MNELLWKFLAGTAAIALAVIAWAWNRNQGDVDDLKKRMLLIEQNHITREEVERLFFESAKSRSEMHQENQKWQSEMRDKIDANEEKRSKTEHAILDVVNELKLKLAVTEAVATDRRRNKET
jgi:hypothetical protein